MTVCGLTNCHPPGNRREDAPPTTAKESYPRVIAREQSDRGDLYKLMKHLNSRHSDGCPQWDTPEESHPSAGSRLVRLWWVAL